MSTCLNKHRERQRRKHKRLLVPTTLRLWPHWRGQETVLQQRTRILPFFFKSDYFKRILISKILSYHTKNDASVVFISSVRVHKVRNSKGSLNLPMANLVPQWSFLIWFIKKPKLLQHIVAEMPCLWLKTVAPPEGMIWKPFQ